MNKRDYNALVQRLEEARHNAIEAAETEYEEAVRALKRLWQLLSGTGDETASAATGVGRGRKKKTARKTTARRGPGRPPKSATERAITAKKKTTRKKRGTRAGRGTLINAMRDAVQKTSGEFTIAEVKEHLKGKQGIDVKNTNPAVFSTTMKRLEELGEIKLIKRGRGRRASVYRRAA